METKPSKKKPIMFVVLGIVLITLLIVGFRKYQYMSTHVGTENAQLEANIIPVASHVAGFVKEVRFRDNQLVHKGDTLILIDDRDLKIKVTQAEVALRAAEAGVSVNRSNASYANSNTSTVKANAETAKAAIETAKSNAEAARASADAAQVRVWKATQDYNRINKLFELKSATSQQLDNAKAEKENAEKQQEAATQQLNAALKQVDVVQKQYSAVVSQEGASKDQSVAVAGQIPVAELMVEQRRQELELAKLQLSYATIIATADGTVSKKSVQPGQYINIGQSLCAITETDNVWVIANYKETQLGSIKEGQKAEIEVDAYAGVIFEGKVESFSAATGAKFSLLPPDNATGNFVKVTQRVPVKIVLTEKPKSEYLLRPGMSVHATVDLK